MNVYHCQRLLLKKEEEVVENGERKSRFVCDRTGLHFLLPLSYTGSESEKTAALCACCDKSCRLLKEHRVR